MERAPQELLPIIPPSVARLLVAVSGPSRRPKRAAAALGASCTTPGWTRARRRAGAHPQAGARPRGIEVILHDTGLHPSQTAVGIDLQDPVHVLGAVQHDGAADRLPGQARPAT